MPNHPSVTVLGISESQVSTTCLLQNGKVVACVSEKRLNRIKSWSGFPVLAVEEVLRIAGLEAGDVDRLVLHGHSPWVYGYELSNAKQLGGKSRRLLSMRETLAICPSPGDDTSAIGAAYWGYEQECLRRIIPFEPQAIENLYLGAEYSDAEIEQSIRRFRAEGLACFEQSEQIAGHVAALLAEGQVVARFDRRMEFGARALGNRSILAHPSNPGVADQDYAISSWVTSY